MSIHIIAHTGYLRPWWIVFLPRLKRVSVIRRRIWIIRQTEKCLNLMHDKIIKQVKDSVFFGGDLNTRVDN